MKILYHIPSLDSIYAHRTIYSGFKNAFLDLGHDFQPLTADHNIQQILESYRPDIFITSSHYYYRKYLDYEILRQYRKEGVFVLTKIDFWNSPMSSLRINEAKSMKKDNIVLKLLKKKFAR